MSIKCTNLMIYECDKCKKEIFRGFNPTGFFFDRGNFKGDLCRNCYEDFCRKFNKIEEEFVKEWLKNDPINGCKEK